MAQKLDVFSNEIYKSEILARDRSVAQWHNVCLTCIIWVWSSSASRMHAPAEFTEYLASQMKH